MISITKIIFYLGITLLIFLGGKLIYELIKKRKSNYLKTLRLLFNFIIILTFCYVAFLNLALIVRVPHKTIRLSKSKSLNNLHQWIFKEELKTIMVGLGVILLIAFFNFLYQKKIEKLNLIEPIIHITLINFFILIVSIFLIHTNVYNGLLYELEIIFL